LAWKALAVVVVASRIRALPNVYVREVDGDAIVLNMETGEYLGFDSVAVAMWNALTTCDSVGEAIARLLDRYDADPHQMRADVIGFVETLQANCLISVEATE
jgi:hypothetical protein